TLAKAIKSGRISHAYLFTGPRGVGKTSIARILAHEVNGLPYDEQQTHIDIIEIDAASNRRIDEIRELRDKIHVAPAMAKYKVYVIDEVHMLTREAFNALLKTLEEPPAHAIFILATTEAHKLPETIVSRTQRYIFRPIEPAKAVKHLRSIASQEKIDITDDALELVVEHGNGSFRDSIGLLDQLSNTEAKIDLTIVQRTLGIAPSEAIESLLAAIREGQTATLIYARLSELFDKGYQPVSVAKQLAAILRQQLMAGATNTTNDIALLSSLLEVALSHDPEAMLEVSILSYSAVVVTQPAVSAKAPDATVGHSESNREPVRRIDKVANATQPIKSEPHAVVQTTAAAVEAAKPVAVPQSLALLDDAPEIVAAAPAAEGSLNPETWQQILDILKKQHNTLYGIVRMAQPDFSKPQALHLAFNFAFHQKRANEAKNRDAIANAVAAVVGSGTVVVCTYNADAKAAQPVLAQVPAPSKQAAVATDTNGNPLSTISNIFGGVEMVE
ncbi:DNA polymerase III subunit gamma/tau, partial [Aeromicrobium sp.]|nr:DNA polymerase III subunit gamma/tau [Candidatus Saccharibacteria bacterium]